MPPQRKGRLACGMRRSRAQPGCRHRRARDAQSTKTRLTGTIACTITSGFDADSDAPGPPCGPYRPIPAHFGPFQPISARSSPFFDRHAALPAHRRTTSEPKRRHDKRDTPKTTQKRPKNEPKTPQKRPRTPKSAIFQPSPRRKERTTVHQRSSMNVRRLPPAPLACLRTSLARRPRPTPTPTGSYSRRASP